MGYRTALHATEAEQQYDQLLAWTARRVERRRRRRMLFRFLAPWPLASVVHRGR